MADITELELEAAAGATKAYDAGDVRGSVEIHNPAGNPIVYRGGPSVTNAAGAAPGIPIYAGDTYFRDSDSSGDDVFLATDGDCTVLVWPT